jgi:chromosome segregation ATPase
MLKWTGVILGVLTMIWVIVQRETISWISLGSGVALASALFVLFYKDEKPASAPIDETQKWQMRMDEQQREASQTIDGLNRELQKIQQKTIRSEERCHSYQKLVEVHQQEIEKLKGENHNLAEQLIQKERKLNELNLSKMEPDLFDMERRQTETINRQLKKQLSDTKNELAKKKLESRDLLL